MQKFLLKKIKNSALQGWLQILLEKLIKYCKMFKWANPV